MCHLVQNQFTSDAFQGDSGSCFNGILTFGIHGSKVKDIQWRPMKAAWFDVSVAQALQAQLGNLMAMRQSLRIQIGVCWLRCLIELAGAEVVNIQT